ncbi:uncharacterized protein VDAG_06945 [Verticillium dahliae VdLs.17]|uniref:Dicer-like protein 2 n=1 Tax=Verticillium dahliae (strain VdLs.17 / ATCC MYA-4575 / FGSC 10137) TaxID=498257 RepID=G2XA42_VERDV|nr:uncharacterized protein VDAG_06945 [Verticillium dahliae VdLs.17]EGY15781.1 hypothetical protein VDAG_06945 [Verticillium dahliae VdLs.17]
MIMMNFYHPRKQSALSVPHVLGLTASPIMRSRLEGLEALEQTLDSVCVTPRLHRDDLMTHVKRPTVCYVHYETTDAKDEPKPVSISSLREACRNMDIRQDPYVICLRDKGTDRARRELIKVLTSHKTDSQQQMKSFFNQSLRVLRDLGPWAAEYYIWKVVTDFLAIIEARDHRMNQRNTEEKQYLANILRQISISEPPVSMLSAHNTSNKVMVLMEYLSSKATDGTVGIIFVKERSTAAMLAHVIESHPLTQNRHSSVGVVVGASTHLVRKKDMWDLSRAAHETEPLLQFRSGHLNLLIATSVLEEGIDVPACNLVICFDEPENLKAFVQRRGRARKKDSSLVVLLPGTDHVPQDWESMEATMRTHYEREQREIQIMEQIEASESAKYEEYVVESTNARLDFENAKAHLSNFCGQLSPGEFIDKRPEYIPRVVDNGVPPSLRVTVLLPSYVPAAVRHAESRRSWKSEHQASKDAAFQAYVALYKAGLVNEHMLPLTVKDIVPANEPRVATLQVNGLLNVWLGIAQAWITSTETWLTPVHLRDATGLTRGTYIMRMPVALPALPSTPVYFDREGPWLLDFGPQERKENLEMPDHTSVLLALHFGHHWSIAHGQQQVISFASQDGELNIRQLSARGFTTADADREEMLYLVRDESGCPYVYDHFLNGKPSLELVQRPFRRIGDSPGFQDAPSNIPYLALRKWPRYLALLHQQKVNDLLPQATNKKPYARVYPAPWAKVDTIPLDHAYFGALIPFISHIVEVRLVAEQLSSSLLRDLNFSDPSLVLAAISTKGSLEATNYERLELLGDSILKLCTTANAAALHGLVSNSRLCRAALDAGLDKFVLTENFTCRTWRPIYVNDMMEKGARDSGPRIMSTKTLADIVEALIGAAYIDGGLPKALGCISIFLRELDWKPLPACQEILYSLASPDVPLPPMLVPLEDLIGYTMHLLKTASVNGDLLGFLALECHAEEDEVIIDIDFSPSDTDFNPQNSAGVEQKLKQTRRKIPLWKFMRHSSIEVVQQQTKAASVHADLRGQIMHALEHGSSYPWSLLARLHPAKFFSDMVEAVLGAVWVDSGDMGACIRVAERLGILPVLSRLAKEDVHVLHPKQELGEIAGPRTVKYLLTLPEDAAGLQSATRKYACKVMVGDRCVAEVDDGVARDEVETKAAEVAVQTLKNEQADAKQVAEH